MKEKIKIICNKFCRFKKFDLSLRGNIARTKPKIKTMQDKFFYFIYKNRYCISDTELCPQSEQTFDIKLFDLATNKHLLPLLGLIYLSGGSAGVSYTNKDHIEFFCRTVSVFNPRNREAKMAKMFTNPTVRIFIEDTNLLTKVKQILTHA